MPKVLSPNKALLTANNFQSGLSSASLVASRSSPLIIGRFSLWPAKR